MTRPRIDEWQHKLSASEGEMEELLRAWQDDLDDAAASLETTTQELEDERGKCLDYGNCKRGCPPAYLNENGFCSPNCEMGQPRRLGEELLLVG